MVTDFPELPPPTDRFSDLTEPERLVVRAFRRWLSGGSWSLQHGGGPGVHGRSREIGTERQRHGDPRRNIDCDGVLADMDLNRRPVRRNRLGQIGNDRRLLPPGSRAGGLAGSVGASDLCQSYRH